MLLQNRDTDCSQTSLLIIEFLPTMAEEKNSLLRQPVNLSLVGTLMSRQSDVTVSIAIEWNLEFEGKTDACCSDSCPFVTCPFS